MQLEKTAVVYIDKGMYAKDETKVITSFNVVTSEGVITQQDYRNPAQDNGRHVLDCIKDDVVGCPKFDMAFSGNKTLTFLANLGKIESGEEITISSLTINGIFEETKIALYSPQELQRLVQPLGHEITFTQLKDVIDALDNINDKIKLSKYIENKFSLNYKHFELDFSDIKLPPEGPIDVKIVFRPKDENCVCDAINYIEHDYSNFYNKIGVDGKHYMDVDQAMQYINELNFDRDDKYVDCIRMANEYSHLISIINNGIPKQFTYRVELKNINTYDVVSQCEINLYTDIHSMYYKLTDVLYCNEDLTKCSINLTHMYELLNNITIESDDKILRNALNDSIKIITGEPKGLYNIIITEETK